MEEAKKKTNIISIIKKNIFLANTASAEMIIFPDRNINIFCPCHTCHYFKNLSVSQMSDV